MPKWLSPENDANRAWIHGSHLRIIPQNKDGDVLSKTITLPKAVETLQSEAESLIYSTFIEAEAFYRLEKYPGQIEASIHHALVTIPRRLAHVIHELPKAIAPAVEAFYLRDPISLKPLTSASTERLAFPPKDLVDVSVKFTKVLYAQLKSQQFSAPPAWQSIFNPSEPDAAAGRSDDEQKKHNMLELGMKVTCGFEMLAVGAAKSNNRTSREVALLIDDLMEDGDPVLPTDRDIASWNDSGRDDDDSWMDISFEDFEKELDGRTGASKAKSFGDANAQADLRKIVSRFEAFLNDEKAGIDGAGFDEMDDDDDDDDDDDSEFEEESDSEDRNVSFDEEEFSRMMREMMGMPAGNIATTRKGKEKASESISDSQEEEEQEEDSEDEEIRKLSDLMAAELNEHGALALDPTPNKPRALKGKGNDTTTTSLRKTDGDEEDEGTSGDEEVDIDYNLAKNLLESFKGQAGLAGPVGTMLAEMGIRLPRDEDDENEK